MDLPIEPGDVLAQPTRARLFTLLGELRRPAGTEELATALGLHPNGVRGHLERLLSAGLVVRERTPQRRGRPRDSWRISPGAQPGGEAPSAYADMARWLTRVIAEGSGDARDAETVGRRIGRELAPAGSDAPVERQLHDVLVALGFQPRRERGPDGHLTYRLTNCPYRDAVGERPQVVCGLHRGITRGLLDAISPATELAAFVPEDPHTAGCLIELDLPFSIAPDATAPDSAASDSAVSDTAAPDAAPHAQPPGGRS